MAKTNTVPKNLLVLSWLNVLEHDILESKKHHLYFNALKSADCPCKCLLGVIRTIGGIETDARSHQKFPAAIRSDPRRSAAICSNPAASKPPFGFRRGVRLGERKRSRCLAHPQRSEPIRTDPNRSDPNRLQLTPTDLLCPFWPPPLCLVEPGFQCSGYNFVFRDLTSHERAKWRQWGGGIQYRNLFECKVGEYLCPAQINAPFLSGLFSSGFS